MTSNTDTKEIPAVIIDDKHEQSLRMRRLIVVFSGYVLLFSCLTFPSHLLGLTRDVNWTGIYLFLVLPLLSFYVCLFILMYSGINRYFRDPGLTFLQQFIGIIVITVVCYYAIETIRGACLLLYVHIFYFSAFHYRLRGFVFLLVETLVLYAGMIFLLIQYHPSDITIKVEVMRLIVLITALSWTAVWGRSLEKLRNKIMRLYIWDELTGTLNRRELFKILAREKSLADRSGIPFCVCMLDLDNFKEINDAFGNKAGNLVLKTFAQSLKENIRVEDYLARYGGKEFMVVFANFECRDNDCDSDSVCVYRLQEMAEKLSFPEISTSLRLTVSIGVANYQAGESMDDLIARVDEALYKARQDG